VYNIFLPELVWREAGYMMRVVRRLVEALVVFLFSTLTLAVFIQVVARYVFNNPPAWTEELARFCQVWIILLTSCICIRKGSHLAVDYLGPSLSPGTRKMVGLFIGSLIVVYSAIVTIWGIRLMAVGSMQLSPAMQINMAVVYAVFPIAGALMVLEGTLATVSRLKEGTEK
jgi:TRAP-type C4-dicarboxylate transport system permease small subunit